MPPSDAAAAAAVMGWCPQCGAAFSSWDAFVEHHLECHLAEKQVLYLQYFHFNERFELCYQCSVERSEEGSDIILSLLYYLKLHRVQTVRSKGFSLKHALEKT